MKAAQRSGLLRGLIVAISAMVAAVQGTVHAQSPGDGPRVVEVRTVPDLPSLAEPFVVEVVLRMGPGLAVEMPDTLIASENVRSVGSGSWSSTPAVRDSVDVLASYPVVGFTSGPVLLPSIELKVAPVGGNAVTVTGPGEGGGAAEGVPAEVRVARLGAVQVAPFAPFEALLEADSALVPREAADVIGRNWSLGVILAGILTALVAAAVIAAAARRWWVARGTALVLRLRGQSPRRQALRELEEIHSAGWHRNGRIDAFYASTTGTLRHFASRIDPDWVPALTSTELLAGIEERWGTGRSAGLRAVIDVSERVKFGGHRPDPESAEADWRAIRDWVREAPEA